MVRSRVLEKRVMNIFVVEVVMRWERIVWVLEGLLGGRVDSDWFRIVIKCLLFYSYVFY